LTGTSACFFLTSALVSAFATGAGLGADFCSTGFTGDFFSSVSCGNCEDLLLKTFE